MSRTDLLGYAASATVLATFCTTSMLRLRLLAMGSNILFILFGAMAHIYPVLLLHLVLLPINLARLMQIRRRIGAYRVPRRRRSGPPLCLGLRGAGLSSNGAVLPHPDLEWCGAGRLDAGDRAAAARSMSYVPSKS
ncbi:MULTISPECIES: hypothetical protein [unclassified Bradyrhizobium]|uniref:hypothetical protein n=1 Tax=unclassified Bradyrhizobium TaxID=2631580 RepID=UPI002479E7EE|nr:MULTISPECIES: hypothetical protein [unclassified Bradyrhizobium]WGR73433.1 hypothetical protein MTX24_11715 [Bradyrhizobium sp. ISRA426]WGR78270.1 hypothetical protein MTX21_36685 [Bradyrhizobium sp. ISRA430]WGR88671.1 hypothetical protein MTX25_11725 [Bradyrhizobium sp. ISRA432]